MSLYFDLLTNHYVFFLVVERHPGHPKFWHLGFRQINPLMKGDCEAAELQGESGIFLD